MHECAHQLTFNSGLFVRHRHLPAWVGEGLAEYFASPSSLLEDDWRGIGKPYPEALKRLEIEGVELEAFIRHDVQFRYSSTLPPAYQRAWGVTYFLFRNRPGPYIEYLRTIAQDVRSDSRTARQRVAIFERTVGDLVELQKEFDDDLRELVGAE
jgi:hypothetical protein